MLHMDKWRPSPGLLMAIIPWAIVAKIVIIFIILPGLRDAIGNLYNYGDYWADFYDLIAENIINGNGYRVYPQTSSTMLRSPGFIFLLAGIFSVFGKSMVVLQAINIVMSTAAAALVYLIAAETLAFPLVAVAAALIYFFHPMTIICETRGSLEVTLTLCLCLGCWLSIKMIRGPRAWVSILFGAVVGVTYLVRPNAVVVFPAFLILYAVFSSHKTELASVVRCSLISAVVAGLVISPWIARNYVITGQFVPTMTSSGLSLFEGYYVTKYFGSEKAFGVTEEELIQQQVEVGKRMGLRMRGEFYPMFFDARDELAYYNALGSVALNEYLNDSGLMMKSIGRNAWAIWFEGKSLAARYLNFIVQVPFLLLGLLGAALMVARNRCGWAYIGAIISFVVPHLFILSQARYCAPIIPMLATLCAYGLVFVLMKSPIRGWRKSEKVSVA